ncbi:M50 family metallopeptidase [Thermodesulfobacteriota bacterium]
MLLFLGLTSALYAIVDIKEDLIVRTIPGSDAYEMSKILPLPPALWGGIWILAAVLAVFFSLKTALKGQRR